MGLLCGFASIMLGFVTVAGEYATAKMHTRGTIAARVGQPTKSGKCGRENPLEFPENDLAKNNWLPRNVRGLTF